jgi:hypothetical protein
MLKKARIVVCFYRACSTGVWLIDWFGKYGKTAHTNPYIVYSARSRNIDPDLWSLALRE